MIAPDPVVARFEAGEHAQMGEDRMVTITSREGEPVEMSQGELIALADFYATPEDMMHAPKVELEALVEDIRRDKDARMGVPGAEPVSTKEWQDDLVDRPEGKGYLDLLADNEGHFGPPTSGGAGGEDHRSLFFRNHLKALQAAHAQASTTKTVPEAATILNGFACHFLTDAFSAGHLFNKAEMLTRVAAAWNAIDEHLGPDQHNSFTDSVAAIVMTNPESAEQLSHYRLDLETIVGVQDITAANLSKLLMAMAWGRPTDFYNVILNLVHDRLDHSVSDPQHGIEAQNARGDTWTTMAGDDTLKQSPETLRISKAAVAQSFRNLEQAAQTSDTLTDTVKDTVVTQEVWDYTPKPTALGTAAMEKLIVEMLDLTSAGTIAAFAAKTIQNLPAAIPEMVRLGYLIPRPNLEPSKPSEPTEP